MTMVLSGRSQVNPIFLLQVRLRDVQPRGKTNNPLKANRYIRTNWNIKGVPMINRKRKIQALPTQQLGRNVNFDPASVLPSRVADVLSVAE